MLTHLIVICVILFGLMYITNILLQKYEIDEYWYYTSRHVIEWLLHILPDIVFVCLVLKCVIWFLTSI